MRVKWNAAVVTTLLAGSSSCAQRSRLKPFVIRAKTISRYQPVIINPAIINPAVINTVELDRSNAQPEAPNTHLRLFTRHDTATTAPNSSLRPTSPATDPAYHSPDDHENPSTKHQESPVIRDGQKCIEIGAATGAGDFGLDDIDYQRLVDVARFVRRASTDNLLSKILPGPQAADVRRAVAACCDFAHCALLVFPEAVEGVLHLLRTLGFQPNDVIPSVVVKQRLTDRYGLDPDLFEVWLTHGALTGWDGIRGEIEVFMAPKSSALSTDMVSAERQYEFEQHFALTVRNPEVAVLKWLCVTLRDTGGFLWDGGGYNPHEDPEGGGRTVLYFAKPVGAGTNVRLCRLELKTAGDFSRLIEQCELRDEILSVFYERAKELPC